MLVCLLADRDGTHSLELDPAVIMWIIGNELNAVYNYAYDPTFLSVIETLVQAAHEEEGPGHRPVTTTLTDNNIADNFPNFTKAVGSHFISFHLFHT